jgi:chemotaxis signal transduction protein
MSVLGFLVVRSGAERLGIEMASVEEVVGLGVPAQVPARLPAFRGVVRWRGRHVAVLHLGALVAGGAPPEARGDTALVVVLGGTPVALEVDAVDAVVEDGGASVGGASVGGALAAGASGVWQVGGALVTMLDVGALAERLAELKEVG